jgi:hypothetical protein
MQRTLLTCSTNRRDRTIIDITQCINAGFVTQKAIVDTPALTGHG